MSSRLAWPPFLEPLLVSFSAARSVASGLSSRRSSRCGGKRNKREPVQLKHNIHLAYCTNIHRGQTWAETWEALKKYTLAVRDRVSAGKPYAIGLRLSDAASRELTDPKTLTDFRRWLEKENCYVFTINGFPYGTFHGGRVKELAYTPDWTTQDRLEYTNRLFDLLGELTPAGVAGSVSTVPG